MSVLNFIGLDFFVFFLHMTSIHQCKHCDAIFNSKYLINKHNGETHQETCNVGGNIIRRIDLMFKCPLCDKTFSNPEYLRKHYKTHLKKIDQSIVLNHEPEKEVYQSIALKEMGLLLNEKFSLLICQGCNIGLLKSQKYLEHHFSNKAHVKKKVC